MNSIQQQRFRSAGFGLHGNVFSIDINEWS